MTTAVLDELGKLADTKLAAGGEESQTIDVKVLGHAEDYERRIPGIQFLDQPATYGNIRDLINSEWQPHVLHFIGHGKLEEQEASLALADKDDEDDVEWCNSNLISKLFYGQSARLVLLQACETAAPGTEPGFMSLASHLVQRNIQAVVAMQFAIRNDYASKFAVGFYEGLRDGLDLDAAVQNGRFKISDCKPRWSERHFGAPVLFMYHPNGIIQPLSSHLPRTVSQSISRPYARPESSTAAPLLTKIERARRMLENALAWLGQSRSQEGDAQARILIERVCNNLQDERPSEARIVGEALELLGWDETEAAINMLRNVHHTLGMRAAIASPSKSVIQPEVGIDPWDPRTTETSRGSLPGVSRPENGK